MLNRGYLFIFVGVFMLVASWVQEAEAAKAVKSQVKGDPTISYESPLGKKDIENNAYNRCLLIKTIKPGIGEVEKTQRAIFDLKSDYASKLYAQSIKISAYIAAENEKSDSATPDLTEEKALIENEITRRLADISRRINIINSFEAGTTLLSVLMYLDSLGDNAYEEFRALQDGSYEYVDDCEVLKK